ncbi:MAG TPA: protealysin inhibitor emfourin [Thermoanaerobaculia bacterium]|nr:protealysin inhibitor emfourin [Thermoanaerobaculia bacterium]
MRIGLTRSGGFSGVLLRREIDTAKLPADQRRMVEQLAARARIERAAPNAEADAFEYEINIDGARYIVDGSSPAWHTLIERITGSTGGG